MCNKHMALTKPCSRNELTVSLPPKPPSPHLGLLDWYGTHARQLPWRQTNEPYRIWISEIMLQQTQVKTVLGRYHAWFERFPDIATLAAAPEDAVLKAWEGLGYYRRARNLHRAAAIIVAGHDGLFPRHFEAIGRLPGIGRSTAGAIASICFGEKRAVLDGNVRRVLGRWLGVSDMAEAELWRLAQQAIDGSNEPAEWNQAMMELGATLCAPRSTACERCPVSDHCLSAFRSPAETPAAGRPMRHLYWQVQLHCCPERGIWLTRRPTEGIWAGLWAPPIVELAERPTAAPTYVHQLTHRRLHLYATGVVRLPDGEGGWSRELADVALPTGIRRLLAKEAIAA